LNKKVSAATALKAFGVSVTAVRIKSSGKESSVSRADPAQKLNITFNFVDNDLQSKQFSGVSNMNNLQPAAFLPDDPMVQAYYAILGVLGLYILYCLMQKTRK
jgi:hypothetical protein